MLKKRGARTIPMGRRSGGVVTFAVAGVTVKLRLPTSSMIKQTMHLSGSNRSNCQVQTVLNAVTDITKESVWFIIIYCFFTVGTVKFAIIICDICWGGIGRVWVCKGGM